MTTDGDTQALTAALTHVFRTYGYEGASLARLSAETGLARASLYHRFPGGKRDMALAVMESEAARFMERIVTPLVDAEEAPEARVRAMTRNLEDFFDSGALACVFEVLSRGEVDESTRRIGAAALSEWVGRLTEVLLAHGLSESEARTRAQAAAKSVAGGLVLNRILSDPAPFTEATARLSDDLLAE